MGVRLAMTLGAADVGFGVLGRHVLDDHVQVADLTAAVVRYGAARTLRRRLVIQQQ